MGEYIKYQLCKKFWGYYKKGGRKGERERERARAGGRATCGNVPVPTVVAHLAVRTSCALLRCMSPIDCRGNEHD
ncbi:unnamed protein product [Nezara viridula]|uniref:Uncharacterized protein n=1 Tax=Nezara viridula TaxID=85310 RepID=A0A9P0HDU0_NEZVI|nr:unnamed protein product [Nezara viridula]